MKKKHTEGAIRAAEIITGLKYGDKEKFPTAHGFKTVEGVADLIQSQTGTEDLIAALERAAGCLEWVTGEWPETGKPKNLFDEARRAISKAKHGK